MAGCPSWAAERTAADVGARLNSEKLLRRTCGLNMGGSKAGGEGMLPEVAVDGVAFRHGARWPEEGSVGDAELFKTSNIDTDSERLQ